MTRSRGVVGAEWARARASPTQQAATAEAQIQPSACSAAAHGSDAGPACAAAWLQRHYPATSQVLGRQEQPPNQ